MNRQSDRVDSAFKQFLSTRFSSKAGNFGASEAHVQIAGGSIGS